MKKALILLGLLALPLGVAAHSEIDGYPETLSLSAPRNGASVGRTVTFSGTGAKPDTALYLDVDGISYLDPEDRNDAGAGREFVPAGRSDASGRFSFTVNLEGDRVVREDADSPGKAISDGRHDFRVFEQFVSQPSRSPAVTLTVGSGQNAVAEKTAGSPSPTPAAGTAETKGASEISPALGLLGAGLLGLLALLVFHRLSPQRQR